MRLPRSKPKPYSESAVTDQDCDSHSCSTCFAMSEGINLLESSQSSILNTMTREELHLLVDSLPEAALEPAEKALQHFQIWPRQPPPVFLQRQDDHRELHSFPTRRSSRSIGWFTTGP